MTTLPAEPLFSAPPIPNHFDSEATLREKWAVYLGVTEEWLYPEWQLVEGGSRPQNLADQRYVSIYSIIRNSPDISLSDIFLDLPGEGGPVDEAQARTFLYQVTRLHNNVLPIEEINQFYLDLHTGNPYSNPKQTREQNQALFDTLYTEWLGLYLQRVREQEIRVRSLLEYQNLLARQVPIVHSDFVTTKVGLRGVAKIRTTSGNVPFEPSNHLLFFNACVATRDVPFIRYEDDQGNVIYKVYREPEYLNKIKMDFITLKLGNEKRPNSIDFKLWADLEKFTQKSFVHGTIDLTNGAMLINGIPIDRITPEQVQTKLLNSFIIALEDLKYESISGEVQLYGPDMRGMRINDGVLFDLVTNHPLFYSYLHIEESIDPAGEKDKFSNIMFSGDVERSSRMEAANIHNPSLASASFTHEVSQVQEVTLSDRTKRILPKDFPYVIMRISKGRSDADVRRFILIFTTLLTVYLDYVIPVNHYYSLFLPAEVRTTVKEQAPLKKVASRINRLKEVFGEALIGPGYARGCQKKFQPIVIEDPVAWEAQQFEWGGRMYHRVALPYPADRPIAYVGCDWPERPFINLTSNPGNSEVPYAPCCQTRQLANNVYFQQYYQKKAVEKKTTTGAIITTDKELGPGRQGHVDPLIDKIFNLADYATDSSRLRFGVLPSPYSAIHCLCQATQVEYQTGTDVQKRTIATHFRENLKSIDPAVFKQELFDSSNDEIRSRLLDDSLIIDTKFYYRGLEELFDVNIYVFERQDKTIAIQVPRHERFHTRYDIDRPTVILYQRASDQYELIVTGEAERNRVESIEYTFPEEVRQVLYDLIQAANTSYLIQVTPGFDPLQNPVRKVTTPEFDQPLLYYHVNMFAAMHIAEILPPEAEIIGQYIDNMGKGRGVQFSFNLRGAQYEASILLPPFQPLNYPQIDYEDSELPLRVALELGQNPYSVDTVDGVLVGLWYSALDIAEAIYVPVAPIRVEVTGRRGPHNPLASDKADTVKRYSRLRTLYDTIEQLVIWIYKLANRTWRINQGRDMTSEEFFTQYVQVMSGRPDTFEAYRPTSAIQLTDVLPITDRIDVAFNYIGRKIQGLVTADGLHFNLYSRKLRDAFEYTVQQLIKNTASLMKKEQRVLDILPIRIKTELLQEDFTKHRYNSILIGDRSYQQWLTIQGDVVATNFRYTVNVEAMLEEQPYLYMTNKGRGYLVQNVRLADKSRSLAAAMNWYTSRFNTGYDTEIHRDDTHIINYPHLVYGINPQNQIIPIENHTDELPNYLEILSYGTNKYAALLPIV